VEEASRSKLVKERRLLCQVEGEKDETSVRIAGIASWLRCVVEVEWTIKHQDVKFKLKSVWKNLE
jgi:hypothetical protein